MSGEIAFTRRGMAIGAVTTIPVAIGVAVMGIVFGIAAGTKGLSIPEVAIMSAIVFAGSAQMLAISLWTHPPDLVGLTLAVGIINLRYAMLAASLEPWLRRMSILQAYGSVAVMADENWAIAMADMRKGGSDAGFFLGGGLTLWTAWVTSSTVGRAAADLIASPAGLGIDFVLIALFVALAVILYRGRGDALPYLVAGIAAYIGWRLLPGTWYVAIGGLAGSLTSVALFQWRGRTVQGEAA